MFTPQKSTTVTSSKQNQLLIAALWGDIAIIATLLTDEDIDLNMTDENGDTALIFAARNGHTAATTALLANEHTEPNIQNKGGYTALILAASMGHAAVITALLANERTDPNIKAKNGDTALILAAKKEHYETITVLLDDERTDPNIQDENGMTALLIAVAEGHTEAITALLANKRTDPNIKNQHGNSALLIAAAEGHTETIKALLANERIDPNIQDENGMTALILAAKKEHYETITVLLDDERTDPNIQDKDGNTALILAASNGYTAAITALLANERTDPNIKIQHGNSALLIAAAEGHTETIKALLANKRTDPNIKNQHGNSVLPIAAAEGHTETIKALLANKRTDPNIKIQHGNSALILAASNGYTAAITALLANERTDPNIKNKHGNSALLIAAAEGHIETIKALLAYERTDPNIKNKHGNTALIIAAIKGHTETVKALLAYERTAPNIQDKDGNTALMQAALNRGASATTALLANERTNPNIKNKHGITALIIAATEGHTETIKALLANKRTDPNIKIQHGNSALLIAASNGYTAAITALLDDERTDPSILDEDGYSALILAASNGYTAAITALLSHERTEPNIQDENGMTALMHATRKGHTQAVKALLANKRTDPYIKDRIGHTALILAAKNEHYKTITALLHDKRTEPNIQDENGMTALMHATRKGHTQAVKALLTDRRIDPNIANNQGKIALNYITSAKHGAIAEILMHDARLISQLNAENIRLVLSKQPSTKILKTIISAHPSLTFSILLHNNINMRSRTVLLQHCESMDYFAADTAKYAELIGLISQNSALFENKKMPVCFKPTLPETPNHLLKLTQLFRLDSLAELEHLLQSCSPILKQQSIGFLAQLSDADKADLIDYIHGWHHIFNNVKTFTANGTLPGQDHDATISQCINADPNRDWAVVLEPHQQFQTLQNANRYADLSKDVAIFLTLLERSFYVQAYGLDLDATAFTAAVQAHYHTLKVKVQRVGENIQLKYQRFGVKFLEDLKKNLETCYPKFIRNNQDKITYTIDREEQQLYYQMAHLDPEHSKIADINTYLKQYPLQLPDETPIAKALTSSGTISATLSLHKALNDPEDLAAIIGKKTLSCLSLCYKHCNGKELPVTVADLQGLLQDLQNNPKMTKSSCLFWSFRENEPAPLQEQSLFKPAVITAISPTVAKAITANEEAALVDSSSGATAESLNMEQPDARSSPSVVNVANSTANPTTAKEGYVSLQALEIIAHSLPARIDSTRRFIQESTGCLPAAADEDVAAATKQQQQHCCAVLEKYLNTIYRQYYQYIEASTAKIDATTTTKMAQLYTNANTLLAQFQRFQTSSHTDPSIQTYYLSAIGDDIEHLIRDLIKLNQAKAYTKTTNNTKTSSGSTATKPSHGFTVHEHGRSANPLWLALKCDIQALRSLSFACYNPNWAKFIGSIYRQVRSLRNSLPAGQSQLQHDFYAQANSLLYHLDFEECIDKQTAVGTVIQNTLGRYNSSRHQCQLITHNHYRYQRNNAILETALTASTLADQPTPVDALFLAFAWHDLQKSYLSEHDIKFSTVLANYGGPCHAIKIVKKLRNDFAHSAESLEQNMTSVAALTAWINQQCARIDTGTYAKYLANNPDQQLKCLLRDAMTQYSQLVSAVVPIAAEPSPGQQDLNHSSSTAFAQQQKSRVVDGSSLCESSTVSKTTADELTARHHGNDNRMGHQHSESKLSIHAKIWTPGLISTAESSSKPSTSG